jgi:hypothetical protein
MSSDPITIRSVPASHGADWIVEGYERLRAAPAPWIGAFVALAVLLLALSRGSSLLQLLGNLALPVLTGGLMLGCEAQARGERFRFTHLFAGFDNPPLKGLLILGLLSILGFTLVALGMVAAFGATLAGALLGGGGLAALQLGPSVVLMLVVALLLLAVLTMALWFAPALVAVHGIGATEALRLSLRACRRNAGAMLLNGLLLALIAIIATIPLGFGWLIAGPVLFASIHAGCRDLFDATAYTELPAAESLPSGG